MGGGGADKTRLLFTHIRYNLNLNFLHRGKELIKSSQNSSCSKTVSNVSLLARVPICLGNEPGSLRLAKLIILYYVVMMTMTGSAGADNYLSFKVVLPFFSCFTEEKIDVQISGSCQCSDKTLKWNRVDQPSRESLVSLINRNDQRDTDSIIIRTGPQPSLTCDGWPSFCSLRLFSKSGEENT